jgi:hypothetical protein
MRKLLFIITAFLSSLSVVAQELQIQNNTGQKPALMEQEGKIYVVLTVCLIILTGIFLFLFRLEKRISKIEQQKE